MSDTLNRRPRKHELEAQRLALKLVAQYGGQNNAADACGISRGRMSFIVKGKFQEVGISEIDVKVLQVVYQLRVSRNQVSDDVRKLLDQFERELAEANQITRKLSITSGQIARLLKRM